MHTLAKKYAALTRISNLPTCWTNVLTGCVIGSTAASAPVAAAPVITLAIIISLFYMAGMALNDLVDVKIDREQRPDRPIASGAISPRAALVFIVMLLTAGTAGLLIFFRHSIYFGLLLIAMIVLYDITHKRHAYSVMFMAACRALIYIISAHAVFAGGAVKEFRATTAIASLVLALYIALVTIIARSENRQQIDKRRWLSIAIMLLAPAAFTLSLPTTIYPCIVAVLLLIILSRAAMFVFSEPPKIKPAVMTWLACICLLDCLLLAVLGSPLAVAAGLCFVVVTLSHRKIGGT
ncbi:MAG: UbiA family prenyltransferase [Planctomycetota bacterium]|jgi:4-hydroxybenzoate polyprenyltransferase